MGKQLSIFVENKPGKISKITGTIEKAGVNLKAMTIADNGTFGIIKIITDKNQQAYQALKEKNFLVSFQEVVIVEIPDKVGAFHKIARLLEDNNVNIEDAYGFILEEGEKAALILKVSDSEKVKSILKRNDYNIREDL
jgi:hypothetical protein